MFRKILNANDGSENAFKALEAACDLTATYGADLHLIIVEELPSLPDTDTIDEIQQIKSREDKGVRAAIKRAQTIAARHGVTVKPHVQAGHVIRNIVDFADDNGFDLLVIGATGHATLYERLLGARAERIAHLAHCPVLIVR